VAENQTELDEFRARCIAFLDDQSTASRASGFDGQREFQKALSDAGLAGLTYAKEFGGAGLTLAHERVWREVQQGYPIMNGEYIISHGMCLPVLNEFGTEEQKRTHMPLNIDGTHLWCQMFSEPGAGSDVASLQTKAELDGDEWILNGQKVWTTLAHVSDFGVVIARTDPDQPKHAGISMFVIDLRSPGVEIRPIHQIDGGKHFNEVFFTDVRLPKGNLLGEFNNGWRQATAMLMYERVAIGSSGSGAVAQPTYDLIVANMPKEKLADPVVRDALMKLYCMESTKSMVAMRTRADLKAGKAPGPGGSLGKLAGSIIARYVRGLALELAGPSTIAWEGSEPTGLNRYVLNSFQSGIAGGTDEIQRNIIGDRVLGLPREPAVDTSVPFKELKVGTQKG
jgi:alkylation response protein AidB-like acyl-CoA dehydrogenase